MIILKNLVWQVKDFPGIWRRSKLDGVVWLGTFLVSVLWDIDFGLAAGLFLSVLSVLLVGQKLRIHPLGRVPDTDLYLDVGHYKMVLKIKF